MILKLTIPAVPHKAEFICCPQAVDDEAQLGASFKPPWLL